jgi:hypothetical protein
LNKRDKFQYQPKLKGGAEMASSNFSAVAEIVPQVSYEIIGRIIPGIVVILSFIVVAMGPVQALIYLDRTVIYPNPAMNGWAVALLMLIAAYIIAIIMNGISQIPVSVRRHRKKLRQSDLKEPSTSMKFDEVNQKLPKAGAWLTKLYAEENMTQVLIIGWVISAIINICYMVTPFSMERMWLEAGLIASAVGAVMVRRSVVATREDSLNNLWALLHNGTFAGEAKSTTGDEG